MSEEKKVLNLMQRINEVRKLIAYVQKDKDVSTGGGSYKAVTHDTVTAMVRPHMISQGIVCFPTLVESTSNPKDEGAKQFRYEATYDFIFCNIDDPADRLTIRIQAHAMDNADKAPGKAMSYAKKYAILKLFEIETGDSDESRFEEKGEFPLEDHLAALEEAINPDDLQSAYMTAKAAAMAWPDPAAFKVLGSKTKELLEKLKAKS